MFLNKISEFCEMVVILNLSIYYFFNFLLIIIFMKNIIKIERAIKNLTQDELAKLIGVSRQTINAIELNKYVPSTLLALKIARVFQKKVDEIFLLEEFD